MGNPASIVVVIQGLFLLPVFQKEYQMYFMLLRGSQIIREVTMKQDRRLKSFSYSNEIKIQKKIYFYTIQNIQFCEINQMR